MLASGTVRTINSRAHKGLKKLLLTRKKAVRLLCRAAVKTLTLSPKSPVTIPTPEESITSIVQSKPFTMLIEQDKITASKSEAITA
jgi:hypothetical protein